MEVSRSWRLRVEEVGERARKLSRMMEGFGGHGKAFVFYRPWKATPLEVNRQENMDSTCSGGRVVLA